MPAPDDLATGPFQAGARLAALTGAEIVKSPLHAVVIGDGPALLLVHGLLASGEMYMPVAQTIARRNRLVIPDLRGQGASASLPGPYTPTQQASDLAALLDFLGIRTTAVLGYSQGGPVTLQLQHERPDLVDAIVLACTYAFNGSTFVERSQAILGRWLMKAIGPQRLGKLALDQGGGAPMNRKQKAWMAGVIAGCPRDKASALFEAAMAFDARPLLGGVSVPTLVVAAADDKAVPARHTNMLREGIPGASYIEVSGAGHFMIVTHSDQFAGIVTDWLSTVEGR